MLTSGSWLLGEAMSLEQLVLWAEWVLMSGQAWQLTHSSTHSYLVFLSVTLIGSLTAHFFPLQCFFLASPAPSMILAYCRHSEVLLTMLIRDNYPIHFNF